MGLKLTYFPAPGLAEVSRLVLTYGNIPFEDDRSITQDNIVGLKPSLPFGQVPILTLDDGKVLAQSGAILRYAAHRAGLYPKDPYAIGLAEQAYFQLLDISSLLRPVNQLPTDEEKKAKREELFAGPVSAKLKKLEQLVAHSDYVTGSELSFADFWIFTQVSLLHAGTTPGVPTGLLDSYPHIKAHRNRIASLPAVKAFYEKETDEVRTKGFRPDPTQA